MGENTKIEWATHTWNPWMGCMKVSPACDHCYAEDMMDARYGRVKWGAGEDRLKTGAGTWSQPRRWNRLAEEAGRIDTVFCLSLGDIWDKEVDPMWRRAAFRTMETTPNLVYLLLSKRIGNAVKMCDPLLGNPLLPRNAALGATMVNQDEWDRDLPKLKEAARILGARFTFASVEPMLGAINARGDLPDWVIVGGESGTHARPMSIQWARELRNQCEALGVPFLFKQWGEWAPARSRPSETPGKFAFGDYEFDRDRMHPIDHYPRQFTMFGAHSVMERVGKKAAGRALDGHVHDGFPELAA